MFGKKKNIEDLEVTSEGVTSNDASEDNGTIEHVVTEEDVKNNPGEGLTVGETIEIPVDDIIDNDEIPPANSPVEESAPTEEITLAEDVDQTTVEESPTADDKKDDEDVVKIGKNLILKKSVVRNRRG